MEPAEWVMLGILAGFAVYDLKTKTIPMAAVATVAVVVVIYRFCTGINIGVLLTGLVPGALVLLFAVATKESIGKGDGLVLCILGMFCGGRQCLAVFGMALVFSAVLAMVLLVCRRAGRKTEIPFLPALFSGYLLFCLW